MINLSDIVKWAWWQNNREEEKSLKSYFLVIKTLRALSSERERRFEVKISLRRGRQIEKWRVGERLFSIWLHLVVVFFTCNRRSDVNNLSAIVSCSTRCEYENKFYSVLNFASMRNIHCTFLYVSFYARISFSMVWNMIVVDVRICTVNELKNGEKIGTNSTIKRDVLKICCYLCENLYI